MFTSHSNLQLPALDDKGESGAMHWDVLRIHKDAPVLLVSMCCQSDRQLPIATYLFCSLDQVVKFCKGDDVVIEKIQLLESTKPTNGGWTLHDIVHIRMGSMPGTDSESASESLYREEYHSKEGRCFTFSKLSDDDPEREPLFESIYTASA